MTQRRDYRVGGTLERTGKWVYKTNAQNAACPATYGGLGLLCRESTSDGGGVELQSRTFKYDGFSRATDVVTAIGSTNY